MQVNKVMNNLYNINRGQYDTPQELFDKLCKSTNGAPVLYNVIATIGWTKIATQIIHFKNELPFFSAGVTLSAFAINYINNVANLKLPRIILEQGTECLKKLTEKIIDYTYNTSETQRNTEKEWWNLFLDVWKEYLKNSLEQESLLVD